jgi:Domain of unknown function (DUF4331)
MQIRRRALPAVGLALTAWLSAGYADASSHREAPFITGLPKVDGTDFYMFRSYEAGREDYVTLVANYLPLQDAYGGPNYFMLDPNAVYEIKIDNDGDAKEDITFQFRFNRQARDITLSVGGEDVAVPVINVGQIGKSGDPKDTGNLNVEEFFHAAIIQNGREGGFKSITNAATRDRRFIKPVDNIGTKTLPDYEAYANAHIYNVALPGCGNGRMFVGQRKEPFAVNLGETFDLVNIANPVGEEFSAAEQSDLNDKNITSLILEVPISCLVDKDPVIAGWTTASIKLDRDLDNGGKGSKRGEREPEMVQVSRLGHPLVNELVIGLKDKDKFNGSRPFSDAQFATYVTNPTLPEILELLFGPAGVRAPELFPRTDLVATFLTGIEGVNQQANGRPAEMLRLNTKTEPTPAGSQNRLGVIGGDAAGFPNGRRPGDDVVDISLRVAMGRLISLGLFGDPAKAPSGALDFTDGAITGAADFKAAFPYLMTPIAGSPSMAAAPKVAKVTP